MNDKNPTTFEDPFLEGNEVIVDAIAAFYKDCDREHLSAVLEAIRARMHADGHFLIPVQTEEEAPNEFTLQMVESRDGSFWFAVFTSREEFEKGAPCKALSNFMNTTLKAMMEKEGAPGVIINPWGQLFMLTKELMGIILA